MNRLSTLLLILCSLIFLPSSYAQHDGQDHGESHHEQADHAHDATHHEEKFNAGETMMHHVMDSHDWHITDFPSTDANGNKVYKPVALHLPWLFYSSEHGVEFFGSTEALLKSRKYVVYHEKPYHLASGASYDAETWGYHPHGHAYGEYAETIIGEKAWDFSPTKTVVQMFLVLLVLALIFLQVAKGYAKNRGKAPKGVQSFFEPFVIFVRDEIARTYLGKKADAYTPYLLTLFFFIWFANLLGMTPFNSNIMGNISITFTLALFSFILIQINGTKDYWQHMFAMPGVPPVMWAIITPIEIFGMFIKPIALMIRLFANISAGHFMLLALVCLIFIMGEGGTNLAGAFGISPLTIIFYIGILCLEVIVGIVQAYVFCLLTAVFMGQAMETHDDHH
ncbi:MAG: F0F1 ATP synthase subunit A [Bacteroidota bacterium]